MSMVCMLLFVFLLVIVVVKLTLVSARTYIYWQYRQACSKLMALPVDREDIQRKLGGVPFYYINCNSHTKRRANMEDNAGQLGLLGGRNALQRVEGVYGRDMTPDGMYTFSDGTTLHFSTDYVAGKDFNPEECGCFCSHMRALREAYDHGDDAALVVEDDVNLHILKVWPTTLPEIMKDAPHGWSFIQLFCSDLIQPRRFVPRTTKRYFGCVAYLVSRSGMRAVLEHVGYLSGDRLVVQRTQSNFYVDLYMYDVVRKSTYMTQPLFITSNNEVESTLQNRTLWSFMGVGTKPGDFGTIKNSLRILNTMIPS